MNTNLHKSNRWNVHLLLAVLGTTGIAGLFFSFTMEVSPMNAILEKDLWRLAAPFFLAVFVTVASIRRIFSVSFSKVEKVIAYIAGLLAAGVTVSFIFNSDMWPSGLQEWLTFAIPIVVLISGIFLVLINSRKQVSRETNHLIAMQVAYIANCLMCLFMFWPNGGDFFPGGWQVGAYFCLATSIVYLIQITLFLAQKDEIAEQIKDSVL